MTIKQLISNVKSELNKTPQAIAQELVNASGYELGMRHTNGAFMLVRDDRVVEMNPGNGVSILADGGGQTVDINANGTTITSNSLQLRVPSSSFYFNYQALNPFWLTNNPLDFISPFIKSPLYPKLPMPTIAGAPSPLDAIFVSPTPTLPVISSPFGGPGVVTGFVPLSTYLNAAPLFGINQQLLILSRNIGEVIKNLSGLGV